MKRHYSSVATLIECKRFLQERLMECVHHIFQSQKYLYLCNESFEECLSYYTHIPDTCSYIIHVGNPLSLKAQYLKALNTYKIIRVKIVYRK
jgi:hypothetical protein